jgi:hypothetical protein
MAKDRLSGKLAVTAALAFQADHSDHLSQLPDDLRPLIRVGISMAEVVIADNTSFRAAR